MARCYDITDNSINLFTNNTCYCYYDTYFQRFNHHRLKYSDITGQNFI